MTRKERIIAGVKGGKSYGEVGAELGVGRGLVAGICRRAGLSTGGIRPEVKSRVLKRAYAEMSAATKAEKKRKLRERWAALTRTERESLMRAARDKRWNSQAQKDAHCAKMRAAKRALQPSA